LPYALCFLGYLSLYFCFRVLYPSNYDGNTINGLFNFSAILRTILFHSLSSISVSHISTILDIINSLNNNYGNFFAAGVSALFTFFISYLCMMNIPYSQRHLIGHTITIGILLIFISTILLAITEKYQAWSLNFSGYIDSRFAYFGVILIITNFCIFTRQFFFLKKENFLAILISLIIAASIAALNFFTSGLNDYVRSQMLNQKEPWNIAKNYLNEIAEPVTKKNITEFLETHPQLKSIAWHPYWNTIPGYSLEDYWFYYFQDLKNNSSK